MTEIVVFSEAEISEQADFAAIGEAARAADEAIVGGAIDYPHHWADIGISQASAVKLSVSAGSLFAAGTLYTTDAAQTVDLQAYLPLVTGDRRWAALLLRGIEETVTAQRMIEIDAVTEEMVEITLPKREVRRWEIVVQQGEASPTPIKPAVAATECCAAWVQLASTGIVAIEMHHPSRVKPLSEVEGRVTLLEGDVSNTTRRVSTIETDVSNLAARLGDIPHPTIIRQIKRDVAALRRQVSLPDTARAYWYDAGLLGDAWDTTHAAWLARIREGIRFAWAAERDAQLALLDPASAAIRSWDTLVMPAWDEVSRIVVEPDAGASINISQVVHTVIDARRRDVSRTITEYGETVNVCENNAEWSMTAGKSVGALFAHAGETFEVVALTGNLDWAGHTWRAVRRIITRTVADTYWDYVTETFGLNGAVYGQTWLNAQPMVLTSIDLPITRVGTAGDLHLVVCECDDGGQPRFDRVIWRSTIAAADLTVGWNRFEIRPSLLESGRHYSWFSVTTGNHAVGTTTGNKYAQGSSWVCTDGVWAQGSAEVDFGMRINAARYSATRTVVEFEPLTLDLGMTDLRLITAGWAPGGTGLIWEILPSGATEWLPLTIAAAEGAAALAGQPALTRLRAVFVGTTDLQPALILDAHARGLTFRPRNTMVAVSQSQAFGLSTTTIQMEVVVDNFDAGLHTIAPKLIVGAATVTPSATVTTIDPTNARRRTVLATFATASTASARAEVDMASSLITDLPFVQNIALYAL